MGEIVDTKAKAPRTDRSACILETRASTTNEMSQRRGVTARDPGWGHPDDACCCISNGSRADRVYYESYCEKVIFFPGRAWLLEDKMGDEMEMLIGRDVPAKVGQRVVMAASMKHDKVIN